MSELITPRVIRADFRWQLLVTVSALVLCATDSIAGAANADEMDRPTVWIELGGQMERVDGADGRFIAPFMEPATTPEILNAASPIAAQTPPRYSIGGEAKISFEPSGTDWVFSAAMRYGRANANREDDHQSQIAPIKLKDFAGNPKYLTPTLQDYSNNHIQSRESHVVVDFAAAKDVGLGLFGQNGSSVVGLGVRFAQFTSRMTADIRVRPDAKGSGIPPKYTFPQYDFHNYALTGQSVRSFHGVGPSLSWNASAPFLGNPGSAEFMFDWGVNGAVLFGRQKAQLNHRTSARHYHPDYSNPTPTPVFGAVTHYQRLYDHSANPARARTVVVPNLGGFAGVSLKFPNAKVSLGYRADFFFGAMDTGIDTVRSSNRNFFGPFATISIGLGG